VEELSVRELLAGSEAVSGDPALAEAAFRLFEFVQFLLDDDDNLTAAGNLNGAARERLRERMNELFDEPPAADAGAATDFDEGEP